MRMLFPVAAEIDACAYLYLREIGEPKDNRLRLVIEEATAGSEKPIEIVGVELGLAKVIESDESCKLFEIQWPDYIAYSVRNESYTTVQASEVFEGKLFRIYSQSYFLEYVQKSTFATTEHPGPCQHIEVICLNHIVDVVAVSPPNVRRLRP